MPSIPTALPVSFEMQIFSGVGSPKEYMCAKGIPSDGRGCCSDLRTSQSTAKDDLAEDKLPTRTRNVTPFTPLAWVPASLRPVANGNSDQAPEQARGFQPHQS